MSVAVSFANEMRLDMNVEFIEWRDELIYTLPVFHFSEDFVYNTTSNSNFMN
jgi:hypothetical protein